VEDHEISTSGRFLFGKWAALKVVSGLITLVKAITFFGVVTFVSNKLLGKMLGEAHYDVEEDFADKVYVSLLGILSHFALLILEAIILGVLQEPDNHLLWIHALMVILVSGVGQVIMRSSDWDAQIESQREMNKLKNDGA